MVKSNVIDATNRSMNVYAHFSKEGLRSPGYITAASIVSYSLYFPTDAAPLTLLDFHRVAVPSPRVLNPAPGLPE